MTVLQRLMNFRATYPGGDLATYAQIQMSDRGTLQAITRNKESVIEVFECPAEWTVWACREFLSASADVSRGKWVVG